MPIEWSDQILLSQLADEPALSEELAAVFERVAFPRGRPPVHLVLDFSGVSYISSSHLAQMLRLRKKLSDQGRSLVLCSLSDNLWSVMLLTGLDRIFRHAPDQATALTALQLERESGPQT